MVASAVTTRRSYCRSCFREDVHIPLPASRPLKWLLSIGSCGLVLVFWPQRCVTCGKLRFRREWGDWWR